MHWAIKALTKPAWSSGRAKQPLQSSEYVETHWYTVIYEFFDDEGQTGYNVVVPALPGCITWGATLEEARRMAEDAIQLYVESLVANGEPVPEDVP